MELAVKALAQTEKGHSVEVEIIAAPRTPGDGNQKCRSKKENEPGPENHPRGLNGGTNPESDPHGGKVNEDDNPQKPPPPPDSTQAGTDFSLIAIRILCQGASQVSVEGR
jgi:hypothetical protein